MIAAGAGLATYPVRPCWIEAVCGVRAIWRGLGYSVRAERRPAVRCATFDDAQNGTKEGVDSVHTLGFGFGCTGLGLGRNGDVFERVADSQGERLVRVPPRARVFPVQGLFSL
jgi:hypothetical protein